MTGYKIIIVPYDPLWPEAYEKEKQRIAVPLAGSVLRFEHMGSTSVPGMASKPIIDISAAVSQLSAVPGLFPTLAALGYKPIEQDSEDRYDLWHVTDGGRPSHILHFMEEASPAWMRPIVFRNALRADASLRDEYMLLKEQLAAECQDDIRKYGKGKSAFVKRVLAEFLDKPA